MEVKVGEETIEEVGEESCIEHGRASEHCWLLYWKGIGPAGAKWLNDLLIFNYSVHDAYCSGLDIYEAM